jgi:hypothetical protein
MAPSKDYHRTFRIAEGQVGWIDQGRAKGRISITYKHSTFQAVQIDEKRMTDAVMVHLQYEDQNFALHATPWERFYAQPLLKNGRPFTPIVTKSGMIIGHCGRVAGSTIWSEDEIPSELKWETWEEFEQSNTVAYYARVTQREADAWRRAGRTSFDSQVLYTIACAIDGQVLQILDVSAVGEIESEGLGPLEVVYDIITGAYAAKSLVKGLLRRILAVGSKRGLKSLIRRISTSVRRRMFRKPVRVLESKGALKPGTFTRTHTDPFTGHKYPISATAKTQRSMVTSIRADVAETEVYKAALRRGEIGLQRPTGANVIGTDFITVVLHPGTKRVKEVIVTDVKASVRGQFKKATTTIPGSWRTEVDNAVAHGRLDLGDTTLEDAIRAAVRQGRVRKRQLNVNYSSSSQGQGQITGRW